MDFSEYQKWTRSKAQMCMTDYDFATNMAMGLKRQGRQQGITRRWYSTSIL